LTHQGNIWYSFDSNKFTYENFIMPSHLRNASKNAFDATVLAGISAASAAGNYAIYRLMIDMVKSSEDPNSFVVGGWPLVLLLESMGTFGTLTAVAAGATAYMSIRFFGQTAVNLKKAIQGAPQEELQEALNPAAPRA
jgi:hypothetical protein